MLDLERETDAQALLEQALAQEPGHPQATYNWGLVRWRRGEITDLALAQQIEAAQANRPGSWLPPYLLGLRHLVALSANDHRALSGSWDRSARFWELDSGKCLGVLTGHTDRVTSVALSPDSRWGLTGSEDRSVRLWSLESGECLRVLDGHSKAVTSVTFDDNVRRILSGSEDRTLRFWELDWEYTFQEHR